MSKDAIDKIWTAVGIGVLFLAVNAVLRVQGSEIFLPTIDYREAERYSTAVYGLIVTAVPYYLLVRLTKIFRRCYGDGTWAGSLPLAFGLDISTKKKTGKEYQRWFAFLFFVVPLVSRGLLLRKVLKAPVYERATGNVAVDPGVVGHLGQRFPIGVIFEDGYRIGALKSGVTYFPFWESLVLVLVEVILWLYLVHAFVRTRDSPSTRQRTSNGQEGISGPS